MRRRDNIIVQFTCITFVVVCAVTIALAVMLSRQMAEQTIRIHIDLFPKFVRQLADDHPVIFNFLGRPPAAELSPEMEHFVANIKAIGPIFRIKIWAPDGTILWSDEAAIIGQRFPDNPEFWTAMAGRVEYALAEPVKSEQCSERGVGNVLEIYTPLVRNGVILGVLELYERADDLFLHIRRHNSFIWKMVAGAGCVLYLLLFSIYYRAYRAQLLARERLLATQDVTISALAFQAELRDRETGLHLDRARAYVQVLAEELQRSATYRAELTHEFIEDLVKATPLHDIGKVGVSDAILCKPGKLTDQEFQEVQRHCEYGATVLHAAQDKLRFKSFLAVAIQIALFHHERWDGQGYPRGLAGEDIPLAGRIMALADMYDALRSRRYYKPPLDHEEARRIIISGRGTQFDPQVVDAFLKREQDIVHIASAMSD